MRIAYLTGQYPRATDTFIQREVAVLRDSQVHVQTFSVRKPAQGEQGGPEQRAERDRTFYLLPVSFIGLLLAMGRLKLGSPLRYLRAFRLAIHTRQPGFKGVFYSLFYFTEACLLADKMRRNQLTHLHNHFGNSSCTVAMLAAELGGFTFSFTLHGSAIFFEPHRWRLDEKLKRALFVSCISHFCRSQGMIFCPPNRWDRLHIVHCGVDPDLSQPVEHQGPGTRLLTVGRLVAVKGIPLLLDAIKQLVPEHPGLVLTLVGDGPDRAAFEKRTQELGLDQHVRFLGYQSQSQVREHLKQTDLFVLPSFAEGVPVVLMEALACGVPVVATRVGGVNELVQDGHSGWLVPPGDVRSFRQAIEKLILDGEMRQRFGDAGRKTVEQQFDVRKEAAWLHRLFQSHLCGEILGLRPDAAEPQADPPHATMPAPTVSQAGAGS